MVLSLIIPGFLFPASSSSVSAEENPQLEWPGFRKDEAGTSHTPVELNLDSILEQWRFRAGSSISSSPVVSRDTVYIAADNRKLYALDLESGQSRWESDTFTNFPLSTGAPTLAGDRIFFVTGGASDRPSYLYAYSTEGHKLWEFAAFGQFTTHSPLVYGSKIFVGASSDIFYCININGNQLWQKALNAPVTSAPVMGANRVFAVTSRGRLYAFDYESHEELFQVDLPIESPSEFRSSPSYYDGVVYVASRSHNNLGEIFAVNAYTGEIIWRTGPTGNFSSSMAVTTNFIYIGTDASTVLAIGRADGRVRWRYSTRGRILSSPAVAGDHIFVTSTDGNIYALDVHGEAKWRYSAGGEMLTSPAVVNNKLIVTQTNNIIAFADNIDFSINAEPSELSLYQGEETNVKLRIQASGSIFQNVMLRTDSLPLGFEAIISPNIIRLSEGQGEANLRITSSKDVRPGTHSFFVIAETAGRTRRVRITIEVEKIQEGNFYIQLTPQNTEIDAGNAIVFQVEVGTRDQFKGTVNLSVLSPPSGFEFSFQESRVEVPGITNLSVLVDITVNPDRYPIAVQGTGGGKRELGRASLVVKGITRHDWKGFGNNNQLINYTQEEIASSLETRYIFQAEGAIRSQPAIVGDTAYFTSERRRDSGHHAMRLYAIDIRSGDKKWDYFLGLSSKPLPEIGKETSEDPPSWISSPRVHEDKLFVGTLDGLLFCFDINSGRPHWFRNLGSSIRSSPTVGDGKVYIGSENNRVYALDIATGEQRWVSELKGPVYSSPAYYNNRVYVSSYDHHVHALSSTNGLPFWSFNGFRSRFKASPTVGERGIYIGGAGENQYFYRINFNGTAKWQMLTAAEIPSTAALNEKDESVYVLNVHERGQVRASELARINTEKREKLWGYSAGGGIATTSPVIADDKILFGAKDKSFNIVGRDGSLIFREVLDADIQGSPAVGRGVILIGTNSGKLYAFSSSILFTLVPEKQLVNIFQGQSTEFNIEVKADSPLRFPVQFSATNLPQGVSVEFFPDELSQFPGTTTMRLSLAPHTPIGSHSIVIVGSSGTHRRTTRIDLRVQNVAPGSFSIKTDESAKEINAGSTVSTRLSIETSGGFNAPVTFSVTSELPDHINVVFNPRTISVPGVTTMSIQVPPTVPPQQFDMTIQGDGGGKRESIIFSVSIYETLTGDFAIRVSPDIETIYSGEKAVFEISAEGWDGFNELITLGKEDFPAHLNAELSPPSIRPGEKALLAISTNVDTPVGEHEFRITGRAQKTTKRITVNLNIIQEQGDFSFNFPPNLLVTMTAGTYKSFSFKPTLSVNWNAPITFSLLNLPPNLHAEIKPATLKPGDSGQEVLVELFALETSPDETYSISLQGRGGGKIRTVHFRVEVMSIQDGYLSLEVSPHFPQIKRDHDTPIEIRAMNARNVAYIEFLFRWDPVLAKISSIHLNESIAHPSVGGTLIHEINQTAGTAVIKVTIPSDEALSGDALVVEIMMSGINQGETVLYIENTIARDKNLDIIPSKGSSMRALVTLYLPGDVNGDGRVDIEDLVLFSRAFGSRKGDPNYDPRADFNNDGVLDGLDLILLAYNWGRSI